MAKERSSNPPLTRQFSAGGIVYRQEDKAVIWLLIRPTGRDTWRLPKGLIDKGESAITAALREVQEETGVTAEIVGKIGQDKYFYFEPKRKTSSAYRLGNKRVYKTVTYYLMRYLQEAKGPISWETEEIAWLPFEEALGRLTFKGEKEILQKGREMLETT